MNEEKTNCSCLGRSPIPTTINDLDDNQTVEVLATFIDEKGETFQTPMKMKVGELKKELKI